MSHEDQKNWGSALKKVARSRGLLGSSALARKVGIAETTAAVWMQSDEMPKLRMGNDFRLAEALGIDIDDLPRLVELVDSPGYPPPSDQRRSGATLAVEIRREPGADGAGSYRTYNIPAAGVPDEDESTFRRKAIERLLACALKLPDEYIVNLAMVMEAAERTASAQEAAQKEAS